MPEEEHKKLVENYLRRHKNGTKSDADKYAMMVMNRRAKLKPKSKKRQATSKKAGSYLTTKGKKKEMMDKALDYTLE